MAVLFHAGDLRAEDGDQEPANPIVVTGEGLADPTERPAYDLTVIARERLTGSASGRIEEVLGSIAGFQQFRRSDSRSSNPSAQGVTLRALGGNATSRALVLLDGVPMGAGVGRSKKQAEQAAAQDTWARLDRELGELPVREEATHG